MKSAEKNISSIAPKFVTLCGKPCWTISHIVEYLYIACESWWRFYSNIKMYTFCTYKDDDEANTYFVWHCANWEKLSLSHSLSRRRSLCWTNTRCRLHFPINVYISQTSQCTTIYTYVYVYIARVVLVCVVECSPRFFNDSTVWKLNDVGCNRFLAICALSTHICWLVRECCFFLCGWCILLKCKIVMTPRRRWWFAAERWSGVPCKNE